MALPTELASLTHELKQGCPSQGFRFEWSSKAQGVHLLLCRDWNRNGRRTSRTIPGPDGLAITKARQQLATPIRAHVLSEGQKLIQLWNQGGSTNSRHRPCQPLITSALKHQKKSVLCLITARQSQDRSKQKHLRHLHGLFDWLESGRMTLDGPNAQRWAREGCDLNTDNCSDRIRIAKWACGHNGIPWVLSPIHKPKAPSVIRPFVDKATDADIHRAISLVSDPVAATFFRVVAATGCRPSEVELLLRKVQEETMRKDFEWRIRWTDLRYLWTLRSDGDGLNSRTAALSQSHSENMHKNVYRRHNPLWQVVAEAVRFAQEISLRVATHV